MRILLVGDTYLPERAAGAVRASELAKRWAAQGHPVTIVTGNPHYPTGKIFDGYPNRLLARDEVNGVPLLRVFTLPYTRGSVIKRIANQILFAFMPALLDRAGPADVVVASSPPLTIGVSGWLMARRRGVPFVFDVRDLYPEAARAYGVLGSGVVYDLFKALERFIYKRASRVVVASRFWSEMMQRDGLAPDKIEVIRNGANTDYFRPEPPDEDVRTRYGIPDNRFLFGYVGLMGRAHGATVIIDAATRLKSVEQIHFLIVGEGSDREAMERGARAAGLENVTFAPSVPAAEVPRLLNACDGGVATLRAVEFTKGAIPVKLFEMMACGLPVVLAGWGESEEILQASGGGYSVPCEDGARLAEALERLAADREKASAMGAKGRAFIVADYDRRKQADRFLEIL